MGRKEETSSVIVSNSNVARWSLSPHIESEALRESRAMIKARRQSRFALAFLILSFPIALVLFFMSLIFMPIGIAMIFFAIRFGMNSKEVALEASEADLVHEFRMAEGSSPRTGWLVNLLVHQGDAPMGSDRGMLWLEDERLYFVGRRTSFGLTADQVSGLVTFDPATPGVRNDLELRLAYDTIAGPLGISVSPIVPGGKVDTSAYSDVIDRVNRWIGRGSATGGQLPPLESGPDAPSLAALSIHAVLSTAYWAILSLLFPVFLLLQQPILAVVLAFLGLLLGCVWTPLWSPWLRLRAWQDRRRLLSNGR